MFKDFKFIKIKKKWYGNLESFYKDNRLGYYDSRIKKIVCNPELVMINPADEKKIRQAYKIQYKKQYKEATKKVIDYSVGMDMLNFCPSVCDGIKEGYAFIIEKEKKESTIRKILNKFKKIGNYIWGSLQR